MSTLSTSAFLSLKRQLWTQNLNVASIHLSFLFRLQSMPLNDCLAWLRNHVLPMFRLRCTWAVFACENQRKSIKLIWLASALGKFNLLTWNLITKTTRKRIMQLMATRFKFISQEWLRLSRFFIQLSCNCFNDCKSGVHNVFGDVGGCEVSDEVEWSDNYAICLSLEIATFFRVIKDTLPKNGMFSVWSRVEVGNFE